MVDAVEDAAGNRLVDKWFVLEPLKPVEVAAYLVSAPFEMLRKNKSAYSYELSDEDRGWIEKVYEEGCGVVRRGGYAGYTQSPPTIAPNPRIKIKRGRNGFRRVRWKASVICPECT
jgi:hypothetical protein